MSAPGLLPAASEEEGSDDAESASAAGTADDVLAGCWSDAYEEVDGKSDAAELEDDSEPADSAADMPSSPLGLHMKAPTYACALFKSHMLVPCSNHIDVVCQAICVHCKTSANFKSLQGQYRMEHWGRSAVVRVAMACYRHAWMIEKAEAAEPCTECEMHTGSGLCCTSSPASLELQNFIYQLWIMHRYRLQATRK